MSAIQTCLSRFAVEIWSPSADSDLRIRDAVIDYLATRARDRGSQLAGIETLRGCFGSMSPGNPVADGIRTFLQRMEVAFTESPSEGLARWQASWSNIDDAQPPAADRGPTREMEVEPRAR